MSGDEPASVEANVFREALDATRLLKWQAGLQAVKKEGGGQIAGKDPEHLTGGAFIDGDCEPSQPQAARWDYVLGYRRPEADVAYFVEVHSASSHGVSEVAAKLDWLRDFLLQPRQEKLNGLIKEFHWVASGKIDIPKHLPQYKFLSTTLRKKGLQGPTKHLTLE